MSAKILVVDDSATDRLIIKNMLSDYQILTASDGFEALRQIEAHSDLDLLILDLNMPGMDGFELLSRLKADSRFCRLRTIILTNFDELESEIRGLKLGAVDYIRKPIHVESLKVRVEIHLELIRIQRMLEKRLFERDLTFSAIFEQAPIGISISHNRDPLPGENLNAAPVSELVSFNPFYEKITGRKKDELIAMGWAGITHPDDLEADLQNYRKLQAGEISSYAMEKRYIRPDGSIVWVHMIVAPLQLGNQSRQNYNEHNHICLVQDITEQKLIQEELRDSERSKAVLLDNMPGMTYRRDFDPQWTMRYISQGCAELTGYQPESLLANRDLSYYDLIVPAYRVMVWNAWEKAVRTHSKVQIEYEIQAADGGQKWVWEQGQALYGQQDEVVALEGLIIDITDRKRNELQLKYLSEHEPLTGLLNLRSFAATISRISQQPGPAERAGAVILINIRRFSVINSVLGFHFGDQLVQKIAASLQPLVTDECGLFHISIDRFIFLLSSAQSRSSLVHFCEQIIWQLELAIYQKTVSFNLGVLELNHQTTGDVDQLLKHVAIAAARVNDHERFGYCFFNQEMAEKLQREVQISHSLTETFHQPDSTSVYMLYQPIVDLKTGQIVGFEGLARFRDPVLGQVSPGEFIPIAESFQLMLPLGRVITRLVMQFAVYLASQGYPDLCVSLNASAIQLLSESFLPDLTSMLNEYGVNPRKLHIEITESVLAMNYLEINEKLEKIRRLGIKIAIDDFGTGYSSLARERELNVDYLKIDKYFIDKLMEINQSIAITSDIISMAHKLGHIVVAEGVEHEKQRQYLLAHQCDRIQGYLISRPLEPAAAVALLAQNSAGHKV